MTALARPGHDAAAGPKTDDPVRPARVGNAATRPLRAALRRTGAWLVALAATVAPLHAVQAQAIDIAPQTLSERLAPGQTLARDLVLGNTGSAALDWTQRADATTVRDFHRTGELGLAVGQNGVHAAVRDPVRRYAYFGTYTQPSAQILKVDLDTLETVDSIVLADGEQLLVSAVVDPDGDYAYFATADYPSRVVKIDLATFERVGAITFGMGEDVARAAVIDPDGRFAYFATDTFPAFVVKVDLATFERVDRLELNEDEFLAYSAFIDPRGQFAYVVTALGNAIVKIDLATFQRVGAIIDGTFDVPSVAMVDALGEFAYVGTNSPPGLLSKIDLAAFQIVDTLSLPVGLGSGVIHPDGDVAYLGTSNQHSPGSILKVDLETFELVSQLEQDAGEEDFGAAVFDPATGNVLSATGSWGAWPGHILRFNDAPRSCTLPAWLDVTPDAGSIAAAGSVDLAVAFDATGLAFGEHAAHLCFDSNDPQRPVATVPVILDVRTVEVAPAALALAVDVGSSVSQTLTLDAVGSSAVTWQIATSTAAAGCAAPASVDWLAVTPDDGSTAGGTSSSIDVVVDGANIGPGTHEVLLCVTTDAPDGALIQVPVTVTATEVPPMLSIDPTRIEASVDIGSSTTELLTLLNGGGATLDWSLHDDNLGAQRLEAFLLEPGEDAPFAAVADPDGRYAYYGMYGTPGRVVKVDLQTFERVGAITLEAGENELSSALIAPDGRYAYFATGFNVRPGRVIRIDLQTFTRVDAITLEEGEHAIRAAAIDPAGEFAYFGNGVEPGRIVKVDLTNFARVDGMLMEHVSEAYFGSAVIDAEGRYAYFGGSYYPTDLGTFPAHVVKLDLANFTRVGALEVTPNGRLRTANLDAEQRYLYVTSAMEGFAANGAVSKIDLATFREVDYFYLEGVEGQIDTAVFDPAGRWALMATSMGAATRMVHIDLETFSRVGQVPVGIGEDNMMSVVLSPDAKYAYFGVTGHSADPLPGRIVKFDTGTVCERPDWLSASPASGSVAGGGSGTLTVGLDADGVEPGVLSSQVCIASNDPAQPVAVVPVEMTVEVPANYATLTGTVSTLGHCSVDPASLAGATLLFQGQGNVSTTAVAAADGLYSAWLPASAGPLDITVSAPGHLDRVLEDVQIVAGAVATHDISLPMEAPCATAGPAALAFDLALGQSGSRTITLGNVAGHAPLDYEIGDTQAPAASPRAHFPAQVRSIAPSATAHLASPLRAPVTRDTRRVSLPQGNGLPPLPVPAYSIAAYTFDHYVRFDVNHPDALSVVAAPAPATVFAQTFRDNDFSRNWFIASTPGGPTELPLNAYGYIDTTTGTLTQVGTLGGAPTGQVLWGSVKWDPVSGKAYALNNPELYEIDFDAGTATRIGRIEGPGLGGEPVFITLAISPDGLLYGLDIAGDILVAIDKTTAQARAIGPTGVDANYAQDMDFDPFTGTLYWAGFSGTDSYFSGIYTLDTGTGAATLVGAVQEMAELTTLSIAQPNDGCTVAQDVPWLAVTPASGSVAPGDDAPLTVSVDAGGLAVGTHEALVCISSNDRVNRRFAVPVSVTVADDPEAPASLLAIAGDAQSAAVGSEFEAPLVVEVRDGNGDVLAGVGVDFAVPATGATATLSAASAVTDAQGRASVVATAAGAIGSYAVTARVHDFAGLTATFALTNSTSTLDVGIAIGAVRDSVRPGQMLDYLVVLENLGGVPATAAAVASELSPLLDVASATWLCVGPSASGCIADGSGELADGGLAVPGGGRVAWLLSAPVRAGASGVVDTAVLASHDGDTNAANDRAVASTAIVLQVFADGFEAEDATLAAVDTRLAAGTTLQFGLRANDDVPIRAVLRGEADVASHGNGAFRIEQLQLGAAAWVRVLVTDATGVERASAWLATDARLPLQVSIADGDVAGAPRSVVLRAVGGERVLPLAGGASAYRVWSATPAERVPGGAG